MVVMFGLLARAAWSAEAGGPAPYYPPTPAPRSIYQQYTPIPTKTPTTAPGVTHVTLHGDSYSVAVNGILDIPFGDYGDKYKTGGGGGAQFVYLSSSDMGLSIFAEYNSVPYSLTVVAKPFISTALGARVLYQMFDVEGMKPFLEGGIGVYFINRAALSSTGTVESAQGAGVGFSGGVGAVYAFTPNVGARLVLDVTSVGIDGGTGENILYAAPSFGIIYTF